MFLSENQIVQRTVPSVPLYHQIQHRLLGICILLAPLTVTVYLLSWINAHGTSVAYSQSIAAVSPTINQLHLIFGILASIFLPLGFFGMALLGMRRSPWLATISAIFALVGWFPFAAIISIDILAYDVAHAGSAPQLVALWEQFNGDPMIMAYQYIYIVGHLLSTILLGILLGGKRLIPGWAAWAFALSSPVTSVLFMLHLVPQFLWIVCVLLIIGAFPAAFAMWQSKGDT